VFTNPPARNVSPQTDPWGRWVETQVKELATSGTQSSQANDNALSAINASLQKLATQVGELNTTVNYLAQFYTKTSTNNGGSSLLSSTSYTAFYTTNMHTGLVIPEGMDLSVTLSAAYMWCGANALVSTQGEGGSTLMSVVVPGSVVYTAGAAHNTTFVHCVADIDNSYPSRSIGQSRTIVIDGAFVPNRNNVTIQAVLGGYKTPSAPNMTAGASYLVCVAQLVPREAGSI